MPEVAAAEAFGDAQGFAVRMAHRVQRSPIVKACGFHDQDIALPVPNRVAMEGWIVEFLRELAAIGENLATRVVDFIQDNGEPRRLHDLDRLGEEILERDAGMT